jgi:ABC-2 type transport system ATP-binding protein
MLEVAELTKHFGLTMALDRLSFSVKKGEILGFLGPNGAGKTTAMRIITGFLTPTSGTARVDGKDIQSHALESRRKIGYLPESVPLYRDMIVEDYLMFVAALKDVDRRHRALHVGDVIKKCGLSEVKSRITGKLSKGFRQRVGLAQALIADPQLLILDEPTEGLDPKQIIEIRQLIKQLGGQSTVLLSTHILPEVSMTCDRVIILNKGRLVAVDTPGNLNRSLQKSMITLLGIRGDTELVTRTLRQLPGVSAVEVQSSTEDSGNFYRVEAGGTADLRSQLAKTVIQNNWELFELKSERMSLEEIFIHLVTDEQSLGPEVQQ